MADLPEPLPSKPSNLSERVGSIWDRIVPLFAGVVKARDVPSLVDVCRWIDRAERTEARIEDMDPSDKAWTQALTGAAIATDKILALSARFGMTPGDRAKLRDTAAPAQTTPRVKTRPATKFDKAGKPSRTAPKAK
ncbi:hypothetical protein FRUB_09796 [Fimbriiglobus ruber]|uniref:Terminase n=1 Tax=Fimbriiglobus ruber TaxID=1908690 RepID=A0A225D5P0_9BACT|nr:hypothetical protein FRUB_09796 [Fimbriiglobus ruber]